MKKLIVMTCLSIAWFIAWLPLGLVALCIGLWAIWIRPKEKKPPLPGATGRKGTETPLPSTSSETTNRSAMTAEDWNKVSLVDMRREGNA